MGVEAHAPVAHDPVLLARILVLAPPNDRDDVINELASLTDDAEREQQGKPRLY